MVATITRWFHRPSDLSGPLAKALDETRSPSGRSLRSCAASGPDLTTNRTTEWQQLLTGELAFSAAAGPPQGILTLMPMETTRPPTAAIRWPNGEVVLAGETGMTEGFGGHRGDRLPNLTVQHNQQPVTKRGLPSNLQTNPLTAAQPKGRAAASRGTNYSTGQRGR